MNFENIRKILTKHVPSTAVAYCLRLWEESPFIFKTTKTRASKVGDFSYRPGRTQRITINEDLHPYLFVTTYIHEVAHLKVHAIHGSRVLAHGNEWKSKFQELLHPLLNHEVYPASLLVILKGHMAAPMASSFSDSALTAAFRQHDEKASKAIFLSRLPEGSIFSLKGKWYKKGMVRRTRGVCLELKSKRKYLVPLDMEVSSAQLTLL